MILKNIKEKLLVSRVRKNDSEAFGEIYDEYIKKIYRFVFFRVKNTEIAEDLSHEVFADLLDYLKRTEHTIDYLQALIYKMARNKVAAHYKATYNHQENGLKEDVILREEDKFKSEVDLEVKVDQKMDLKIVMELIKKLDNQEFKEAIIMRYVEDMSYKEIAKAMDKSINNVRVMLHRALRELKEKINQINV